LEELRWLMIASHSQRVQIAEWAIGAWLAHAHHFRTFMAQAENEEWNMNFGLSGSTTDSPGLRMYVLESFLFFFLPCRVSFLLIKSISRGILGYGTIGRQVARLANALGMEIYVQTSSPRTTPESKKLQEYHVPGTSDPDGLLPAKWFSGSGPEAINHFLSQDLDIVLLSLPMSPETKGCIGAEQFKILSKKKPFLINIARGPIVDTPALIEALETGLIRGAALDVTDPEPLPKGHPLWKAPNVFITPHISWQSSRLTERISNIILENLERWDKGEPLLNRVKR
jgi:phosphoglycerate dehydrogenase-like enzyme